MVFYERASVYLFDTELMSQLVQKVLTGIYIKIILSKFNAPHDTISTAENFILFKNIWDISVASSVNDGTRASLNVFCENFQIANLRIDETVDTYPPSSSNSPANHAKNILIDNQILLVGSHNIYSQIENSKSTYGAPVSAVT
jgi:phosphatidylserine/phosphatidylglycerophosphate/cardiolipin synthase-like enzyme